MAFPRYESYKDSGVEWLGEIPESWDLQSIRAVTELKSERNRPDLPVLSVYREYGVLLKNSRDDNHNATSLDISNYKAVRVGDLVINKMKAWQGSMGISEHNGIVSPAYITCRVNHEKIEPKFLHYLLRSKIYIGIYNALSYGVRVGQWDMHYEDFKKIPLPLPSVDEQKRIANFIDRITSDIDQAIAKKQRLIELLNEQKAILINRAVTKGLNPNVPMRDSGIEWIGEIPEHWEVKRLKFISSIKYGLGQPPREKENGLPLIRATNVERGEIVTKDLIRVDPNDIPYERDPVLKAGDIIVVRSGAYTADSAIVTQEYEGSIAGYDMVVRASKQIIAKYLGFCLLAKYVLFDQLYPLRLRAAQPHLNAEELGDTLILIPPFKEQQEIILHLEVLGEEQKNITAITRKEIKLLNELKQLTIANAVTGKIKV